MNNNFSKNFVYLSQLIGLPVKNSYKRNNIGKVSDIAVSLKEMYPKATGLVVRKNWSTAKIFIPWKEVNQIFEDEAVFVTVKDEVYAQSLTLPENDILIKETFWDKQVVDVSGSKVVRVNDLHMLRENSNMWLVHMDVGINGLIRRLGWSRGFNFFIKLFFGYEFKDKLAAWKSIQPVTTDKSSDILSLKTSVLNLSELHPADLADILIDLGVDERIAILKSLDSSTAARTFQELPLKTRVQTAELIGQNVLLSIVNEMPIDETVDFLSELSGKKLEAILTRLPEEKTAQIRKLMTISERVAGSIMNTDYIFVRQKALASEAMDKIKAESKKKESIYYVYVLDDNDLLVGVLTLRQLLNAQPLKPVVELMRKRVAKVKLDAHVHSVAEVFYKYDFTVVPVVDDNNKLQGIITMKDAFESVFAKIREETEETK